MKKQIVTILFAALVTVMAGSRAQAQMLEPELPCFGGGMRVCVPTGTGCPTQQSTTDICDLKAAACSRTLAGASCTALGSPQCNEGAEIYCQWAPLP